jgi:hypothetical protein
MSRMSERIIAAHDKPADAIGKILMAHAKEMSVLWSLHGRTTNIEFETYRLLKGRSDETT